MNLAYDGGAWFVIIIDHDLNIVVLISLHIVERASSRINPSPIGVIKFSPGLSELVKFLDRNVCQLDQWIFNYLMKFGDRSSSKPFTLHVK